MSEKCKADELANEGSEGAPETGAATEAGRIGGLVEGALGGAQPEAILGRIAGVLPEGALEQASKMLDQDGDGNPVNDISRLAGQFLRRT